MTSDDELLFDESDSSDQSAKVVAEIECWRVLIVDDEPDVHQITKLALVNFKFKNKGLHFFHAHSAKEAYAILQETPGIAVILLDVVMETDHAGLDLVQQIRGELENNSVRIVLRTGQPGVAPERDVITNYDINDYLEKTELSAQKLFTVLVASLRAYWDFLKLEENREQILLVNQHLTEERERIQVTLDSIGDAVLTTDANGKISHLNPVAEKLTGWTLQDAIGQAIEVVFPIIDASSGETIRSPVEKVIASGETVYLSNHTTLVSKTGRQYQIADSAAAIRNANNSIIGVILVFNDVTEQYALREEALKSRRNLQMIMDFTPSVIYAKDIEGRYIFVNQKFISLFNVDSESVIGKTDYDIFSKEFADDFTANDAAVLAAGVALESEESAPHDDEIRHYLSVKFPIFDDENNAYAICGISTDISERKKQEEQIRRSQKMEAIGQLTGGIAHDFNNQLGVVLGYLDFLKEYVSDDEKPTKWISVATNAAMRCEDLTRQLLSFSRTHSNTRALVDINKNINELNTMFSRSLTPAIEVQYVLAEGLWLTEIDAGEFQDVILNLVINARDAMFDGGKLVIETSNKYIDADYCSLTPGAIPGNYVQVMFGDTGVGMDKETQERIFEPFYTTKEKGKGTGLGMSMVYGFVKRYDGFVKIYSEVDVGTTIRLYFPRSEKTPVNITEEDIHHNEAPSGNELILIVEDEIDLLHLADRHLSDLGYTTLLAENAEQALDILSKHPDIDCLFSDVVMPGGCDGFELAKLAVAENLNLKVLMTSGFTSRMVSGNKQEQSNYKLLNKPYRRIDLALCLRKVLDEDVM